MSILKILLDNLNEKPKPGRIESWLIIILIPWMSPKYQNPFPIYVFSLISSNTLFPKILELSPFIFH